MKTRGQILAENIIFIILNLIFLSILILFIFSKTGSEALLEEKYAKQIALIIDSARPIMTIELNMEDAIEKAGENNFAPENIVSVVGNTVVVKLREKSEYSYSFFNNVDVSVFPNSAFEPNGYVIKINGYNN